MPHLHLDTALFILFHLLFFKSDKQTLCFSDSCRSELEQLANNAACDLIGLVTFAGRVERVRSKANKGLCFIFQLNWFIHLVMFIVYTCSPLSAREILDLSLAARSGWNVGPAVCLGALFFISAWNIQSDLSKWATSPQTLSLLLNLEICHFSSNTSFSCSDVPGVHSDEGLSGGRLVAVPHKQLWNRDLHHGWLSLLHRSANTVVEALI